MINFRNFLIYRAALDSEFCKGGVQAPNFFGHTKVEVKKISDFFCLLSTLDSEFYRGVVWAPTVFGLTKFEVKFFGIFSFAEHC